MGGLLSWTLARVTLADEDTGIGGDPPWVALVLGLAGRCAHVTVCLALNSDGFIKLLP